MARKKPNVVKKAIEQPPMQRVVAIELAIPGYPVVSGQLDLPVDQVSTLGETIVEAHELLHSLHEKLASGEWKKA